MKRLHMWVLAIMIIIIQGFASTALAQTRLILILWHGLTWEDVTASSLFAEDIMALGTMNTRAAGGHILSGAYLTLASGARAYGSTTAGQLLHGYENYQGTTAQDIYRLRTGSLAEQVAIVHLDLAAIISAYAQANHPLEVGALVERLTSRGLSIAVFGNSDLKDQSVRWAGLVGMNAAGQAQGLVSEELLLIDHSYPHGKHTNYPLLLETVLENQADLAIIDLGDPYRYSTYIPFLLPEQEQLLRERMVKEAWDFIIGLHHSLPDATLIIASPYPSEPRAKAGQWLAPLIIIGQGPGLLTSGTTRWRGIICNIDIAPTLANLLHVDKGVMLGRTIEVETMSTKKALEVISTTEERIFWLHQYRSQVLRAIVAVQIILYITTLVLLVMPRFSYPKLVNFIQFCLAGNLTIPLMLLLLPVGWYIIPVMIILLVIAYWRNCNQLRVIALISIITALIILIDILRGSPWMRYSFLGYDPIGGARFYGLGNEYMGILIGALIMGLTLMRDLGLLKEIVPLYLDLIVFLAVIVLIALPQLGTNVGGTIAAIAGFGVTWNLLYRKRFRVWDWLVLGGVVLLALAALMYIDGRRSEAAQSHVGQTVQLLQKNGLAVIGEIIYRKLNMNLKLLRYSIWSRALIAAVLVMGASLIWPSRYLYWLIDSHPYVFYGISGTLVGTIAALVFNDSGVVAAATCSVYAAATMLNLALALKHDLLPAQSHIQHHTDS